MTDASLSTNSDSARLELRAVKVAIACAVIGASVKLVAGVITSSMSLMSSAVDSLGDLLVSAVNVLVIRVANSPPDEEHNYGHARIEGLGAMFEGGFILAAGAFILYEAGHKIVIGEESHDSTLGIALMIPVLAMTTATVLYLRKVARQTGSLVIKTDALHYLTDVWVNLGVLLSLALVKLTGQPLIDPIVSMIIALYMLWSSLHVVRDGFHIVMDRRLDPEVVARIEALLSAQPRIESFHDLRTHGGRLPHIDFHIVVRPEMTALELHQLFLDLRAAIRDVVGPSSRVLIHADPSGHDEGGA